MLLFIHGFGSSGRGDKAQLLRSWCQEQGISFMAPSLPNIPELAIETLQEIIEAIQQHEPVGLVGSSLGGFYATWLANHYHLPYVLVNPSVEPYVTLERAIGQGVNFHDQSSYEWNTQHTASLRQFKLDKPAKDCLLMVQTGDELLDYRQAVNYYSAAEQLVEEGGNHGFTGFNRHLAKITNFLRL
ncbi:YqiA/YcfP family alpha/beta fold hydrolase [Marinospirillum insulare]|uniref:Esterase YqiA n=1 Tax=Marinospirillum insulare TaxID=217169 RepID=A0ABQ6A0M4_9GAMM|nr:YqiA/YcfP family alpha/beta fold hydrolase [Marinospirillum insulare]GLR64918.1 esterase YqiA [Marinospirillum insulare]